MAFHGILVALEVAICLVCSEIHHNLCAKVVLPTSYSRPMTNRAETAQLSTILLHLSFHLSSLDIFFSDTNFCGTRSGLKKQMLR